MKKIFLALLLVITVTTPVMARIDMVPRLIVMEDRQRSSEVTVINLSNDTREITMDIIDFKQLAPLGNYEPLNELLNPEFNHNEIVRFSPRSFTLGAMGKQKVRISLRKPSDLPEGEYRFHIRGVSKGYNNNPSASTDDVTVGMSINVGVSIPVIVRQGDVSVTSKLKDFQLVGPEGNARKPQLKFTATRDGNAGALGEMTVEWAKDGSSYQEIGKITNFNIFPEINEREGAIPLTAVPTGGTLRVKYTDHETGQVYDEVIFDL